MPEPILNSKLPFRLFEDTDTAIGPKYAEPLKAWKTDPSPGNADKLLTAVKPIIDKAVGQYVGSSASPTIRSKAKLMALNALGSFDPSKAQLNTHLLSQLQGLRRHAAQENKIISIPERVSLDWKRLKDEEDRIRNEFGTEPSDAQIADATGLSLKRIAYVRQLSPTLPEGTYAASRGSDENQMFSPAVEGRQEPGNKAWSEFVYHGLSNADQVIMEHSLGLHGKPILTNAQIAAKLRISPPAVSQRRLKIQNLMDQREELGMF